MKPKISLLNKVCLTIILTFGICLAANAQKLEKPKIDKIEGDTTWRTSDERIYTKLGWASGDVLYAYALKIRKSYVLALRLESANGPGYFTIGKDNITNIKFTDNSILDLVPANEDDYARKQYFDTGTKTTALVYYHLSGTAIEQLKTKLVAIIRISTSGAANLDFEIKTKNADIIKKEIVLITSK